MTGTLGSCGERTAIKNQTSVDEVVRREEDATDGRKGETLMVGMKVAIQTVHAQTLSRWRLCFYLFRFLFLSAVEEEEAAATMG